MRIDHDIIYNWIEPNSRVLDLGCGDGTLLKNLQDTKNIHGYGLEISEAGINECIKKGVNVIEQNLDRGLGNFDDKSFDTVIMSQTIQTMHYPNLVLEEMLRVGHQCIITFPNFGHWRARLHLTLSGRMPVSDLLPYEWYDTPNIHFCTFKDFDILCHELKLKVLNRETVGHSNMGKWLSHIKPNLFGVTGIYRLSL